MIRKIFASLLIFFIINFTYLPVLARTEDYNSSRIIDAQYKTEFNINKASKGEVVQFISTENYQIDGVVIPKGTIFDGEIKHFNKGRWGYRRAKAIVKINKMIMPNGETYQIKAFTKRHVLKGSAMANVGKGIISFPVALVVGVAGAVVIIVEAVSIAGIIAIGPTTYAFGRIMGGLTHGVNYKKHQGDEIQLKVKDIGNSSTI